MYSKGTVGQSKSDSLFILFLLLLSTIQILSRNRIGFKNIFLLCNKLFAIAYPMYE